MTKVLGLYYTSYGHTEQMADAIVGEVVPWELDGAP